MNPFPLITAAVFESLNETHKCRARSIYERGTRRRLCFDQVRDELYFYLCLHDRQDANDLYAELEAMEQAEQEAAKPHADDRITLHLTPDGWLAEFGGPHAEGYVSLFGTATLPTAYTAKTPAAQVMRTMQANHPGITIKLAEVL